MDPLARSQAPQATLGARAPALRPDGASPVQAAQQFEALFVAELLKRAQQPAFGETPFSGGSAGALYRDLFAEEVAQRIAARGGLGLARALVDASPAARAEKP